MNRLVFAAASAAALIAGARPTVSLSIAPAHVEAISAAFTSQPAEESARINAFFERVFQRDLARSPIRESRLGITAHQSQWDDVSDRRQRLDAELTKSDLRELHRFDPSHLSAEAQLSYRLFERSCDEKLKAFQWRRNDYLITQMGGLHRTIATTLLNSHPIKERADADAYIARLTAVKPLMAQFVAELQRQERAGVLPPRFVYTLTIEESRNLIAGRPFDESGSDSPILADFSGKVEGRTGRRSIATASKPGRGKLCWRVSGRVTGNLSRTSKPRSARPPTPMVCGNCRAALPSTATRWKATQRCR
jgi:uncharacterized protein (DUF885 family)